MSDLRPARSRAERAARQLRAGPSPSMSGPQEAPEAHVELALDEIKDTVQLRTCHAQCLTEELPRFGEDFLAREGDPSRDGRAVNAVDGTDGIDVQPVEVMHPEHVAFVGGKRSHCSLNGPLHFGS